MKKHLLVAAALHAAACVGPAGAADTYPMKPVRVIVPYPPGGSSDIVARIVTGGLSEEFGRQFVVDNRGGAGGIIGAETAARALPDGYTLLQAVVGQVAIAPHLYKKLPYDPVTDYRPVALEVAMPLLLIATPSLPAASVKELLALAKSTPGRLNFSSSGKGGSTHLSGEMLKLMAGIDIVHVAYKGAAPSITAVMSGEVSLAFDGIASALPHVNAGRLKALGISIKRRSSIAPNIPTIDESGVRGFDASAWMGIMSPAKTPDAVVQRLNLAVNNVLRKPETRQRLLDHGAEILGGTPTEFRDFLAAEIRKWGNVVSKTDLRKE